MSPEKRWPTRLFPSAGLTGRNTVSGCGLAPSTPSAENHFELTVDKPATLWLQLVSLFPPTYHGRANGNRADLMEKLAAMHPAFLRFPGGNYLEGNRIETRFDWKKMIGPLVDRPTHPPPGAITRRTAWGCWNSSSGAKT